MKETFIIEETGEVITANVESVTDIPLSRLKEVNKLYNKQKLRLFSNTEKKTLSNKTSKRNNMKETFIIEETGEEITIDVKESHKVSPEQAKKVDREYRKTKYKKREN